MAKAKPTSTKSTESSSTINVSKKSLIGLIITVVVLITLIAGAIGGAAIYFFASQTKMPSWAETYLAHIKTVRNQTPANADENTDEEDSEAFWTDSGANPKVSFYESNDNSPMMLVNYTSVENNLNYNSVVVYSIQNEEIYLLNYENTSFYYIYDIDNEEYNFYLKSEDQDKDENTYINIDDYFQDPESEESEYETTCSADESAKDFCGDIFAEEPIELPSFEYSDKMNDQELAEAIANTSEQVTTEEETKTQTADKLQQSVTAAQERIKEKAKTPEFFLVDGKQIRYGKYESVGDNQGTGEADITLNPDSTATYIYYDYDYDTQQTVKRLVTSKFTVRTIQNGDVLSTGVGCVAADGGPCFNSTFNGRTALIIEPDGQYKKYPQAFFVTHEAPSDPSQRSETLPYGCDFEPVMAQMYGCYRFLSK